MLGHEGGAAALFEQRVSSGGCGNDAGKGVVQLFGFVIVDRNHEAPSTFERNAHDDEPTLLNGLHWYVAGPRLHGCHQIVPFRGMLTPIIRDFCASP